MAKRKKTTRKAGATLRERLPGAEMLRSPQVWTAAAWAAAGGVAVLGWFAGVPRLEAYASTHHASDRVEARFVELPGWARGELEASLLETVTARIGGSPLGREDLVAARAALLETGWFDEVTQVRRTTPGGIEIEARFAVPFAVVRVGGVDHLVDVRGRVLPRSFPAGSAPLPAVVGPALVRGEGDHRMLDPMDWAAAFGVLELTHARPWHGQVAEVHVEGRGRRIRLVTDRGCTILWGRAPGHEGGTEVPADRKLGYLEYHFEHYGHIDRGFLRELDITGDVVVGR